MKRIPAETYLKLGLVGIRNDAGSIRAGRATVGHDLAHDLGFENGRVPAPLVRTAVCDAGVHVAILAPLELFALCLG